MNQRNIGKNLGRQIGKLFKFKTKNHKRIVNLILNGSLTALISIFGLAATISSPVSLAITDTNAVTVITKNEVAAKETSYNSAKTISDKDYESYQKALDELKNKNSEIIVLKSNIKNKTILFEGLSDSIKMLIPDTDPEAEAKAEITKISEELDYLNIKLSLVEEKELPNLILLERETKLLYDKSNTLTQSLYLDFINTKQEYEKIKTQILTEPVNISNPSKENNETTNTLVPNVPNVPNVPSSINPIDLPVTPTTPAVPMVNSPVSIPTPIALPTTKLETSSITRIEYTDQTYSTIEYKAVLVAVESPSRLSRTGGTQNTTLVVGGVILFVLTIVWLVFLLRKTKK